MYRERTSRSTMRVRSAAKSIAWPIDQLPQAQPINYRSPRDQEGNQDRREDQRCRGHGKSRLYEVFHRYGHPVPGRDLHDDDVARGPEDRRVAGERRARGEPEPELRRASRNDRREQENRRQGPPTATRPGSGTRRTRPPRRPSPRASRRDLSVEGARAPRILHGPTGPRGPSETRARRGRSQPRGRRPSPGEDTP